MTKYCFLIIFLLYSSIAKSNFYFLLESCEFSYKQNEKIYYLTQLTHIDIKYLEKLKEYISNLNCENLELYYLVMSGEISFHHGLLKEDTYLKLYAYAQKHENEVAYELGKYQEMSYLSSNQQFDKAIEIGISFVQKRPNSVIFPFMVKKIGRLFRKKGDKTNASAYFKESFELAMATDNYFFKTKIYLDYLLYKGEEASEELEYQGEVLLKIPPKYPWEKLESKVRYAMLMAKGKEQLKQNNYEKALDYYEKALDYFENPLQDQLRLGGFYKNHSNFSILKCYIEQGEYSNARGIIENFYLQEIILQNYYSQFLEYAIETYRALGKYSKVDEYAQLYIAYQKATFDREQNRLIADINEKYKTVEKDKQLLIEKNTNQTYFFALLFALLLIPFISYIYYRNQKIVTQELLLKKQRTKELEELDVFKSNLFAQMAHEFRTPLTLIQSPIELMKEGKLKGDINQYYKIVLHNTNHLLGLVNQMLIFSKKDTHKMHLEKRKEDVILFVKNIFNQIEALAKEKDIDFLLQIPQDSCFVFIDKLVIQRIIFNLLHNAIKYTPNGGKVSLSLWTTQDSWHIKIEDTGIGIQEENLETIFDSFYRSKQEGVKTEAGFGLGLYIVEELSLLHNGKVEVESELDKGSTFTLHFEVEEGEELPVLAWSSQPMSLSASEESTERQAIDNTIVVQKGSRDLPVLLIVEDNKDLQQLFADQLSEDYQIQSAFNGLDALEIIEESIPDIILSDVMMPKMDGIEMATKIRTNVLSSHIPLLLLTALDAKTVEHEGLIAGATDFLTKPINFDVLKLKLKNQLDVLKASQNQILKKVINSANQQPDVINMDGTYVPKADNFLVVLGHLDASFLKDIQNIVKDNFDNEQFSIEFLSKEMGISRSNLFQKVKALTGLSISAFIRKYKLHLAKKLIKEGKGNVSEVANMVGIRNISYFSRIFKEEFGVSAKQIGNLRTV